MADHIGINTSHAGAGDALVLDIGPEKKFFYGRFVEVGTIHIRPKPFIRPSVHS